MAEAFFFLIAVLVIVFILAILPPPEEGTMQERRNNPELNTNELNIHNDRLDKFNKSKFKGVTYICPRDGYYYYSANWKKVYCY
tara:strand:+ start:222 stop:473 length:252 start_codon:yes stop_codon:yes gene_type:complete